MGRVYRLVGRNGIEGIISILGASKKWKENPRFIYIPYLKLAGNKLDIEQHLLTEGWKKGDISTALSYFYFDSSSTFTGDILGFFDQDRPLPTAKSVHQDTTHTVDTAKEGYATYRRTRSSYSSITLSRRRERVSKMEKDLKKEMCEAHDGEDLFEELCSIKTIVRKVKLGNHDIGLASVSIKGKNELGERKSYRRINERPHYLWIDSNEHEGKAENKKAPSEREAVRANEDARESVSKKVALQTEKVAKPGLSVTFRRIKRYGRLVVF